MLSDLIKNRKSVRKYLNKPIPREDLKTILDAGYLAPSWMNSQPWKFIAVENQATKDILFELSNNQPQVKNAAALIVCVGDKNAWSKEEFSQVLLNKGIKKEGVEKIFSIPLLYPPLQGDNMTLLRTVEQVTYGVSYMMLQAYDLGIDSCIIGALFNEMTTKNPEVEQKAKEVLNLKENDVITTIIALGYAKDKEKTEKQRKDYNKVVFFEKID